ncbi:putative PIF1 DNA helicase/replication protein A1-like protein [Tanacetum coccineum]
MRCDTYSTIRNTVQQGSSDPTQLGKPIVLPSTFTGGARYMMQNYMDAMALCRWYGCPDLFITITCNPNWPEVSCYMRDHNLAPNDRLDALSRVFKMKLDQLVKDVKDLRLFGHVHADEPDQSCMVDMKFSKKFPKRFTKHSSLDQDGYPIYRRRDNENFVEKSGHQLHNGYVIPYNKTILKCNQSHINVEWCSQTGSIKYLFKYINKGPDRVRAELYDDSNSNASETDEMSVPKDEIKSSLDCRYISSCESVWRIYRFDIHHRYPSIQRLSFHLPSENVVVYDEDAGDAFYYRMLLNHIPGIRSHKDLRTIDDVEYLTYKEACYAMGLWKMTKKTWHLLSQDVEHIRRLILNAPDLVVTDEEKKNVALFYIRELMRSRGSSVGHFKDMPYLDEMSILDFGNRLLYDELDYDPSELQREYVQLYSRLTLEQKGVYDTIMDSIEIDVSEIRDFAEWILKLGDGDLGDANDGEDKIDIPDEMLIKDSSDPVGSIIDFTYPNMLDNLDDNNYFIEKAYERENGASINETVFSIEFVNGLKFSSVPNHELKLKVGVPIMLLQNIDQANGLCNGTRLRVDRLMKTAIHTTIINESHVGKQVLIARMRISPSDKRLPIKIVRKQFPVSVSFAMTINKSQGQSLGQVGLYLPRPIFTHGQLYVAVSRVRSKKGLKMVIYDEDKNLTNTTTNVVYKEVLHNL